MYMYTGLEEYFSMALPWTHVYTFVYICIYIHVCSYVYIYNYMYLHVYRSGAVF